MKYINPFSSLLPKVERPTVTDETCINPDDHDDALEQHACPTDVSRSQPPDESAILKQLADIQSLCQTHDTDLKSAFTLLEKLKKTNHDPGNNEEYLRIVAECQRITGDHANGTLERHALNPAIETVFDLATAVQDLSKLSENLGESQTCPLVQSLLNSISEVVKLANSKCEHLDITKISPHDLEVFDPKKHQIKQTVTTGDSDKHKKIKATLIPGLTYHGKVLREAKVCVYRYVKS